MISFLLVSDNPIQRFSFFIFTRMSQKSVLKPPAKVVRPSGLVPPKTLTSKNSESSVTPPRSDCDKALSEASVGSAECSATDQTSKESGVRLSSAGSQSGDTFKFGDCVWVSGTKQGNIAFIGETQFAAGVWAGVILNEPLGKNDGSVAGVRYFMCQPLYGIFSKLTNLSHCPSSKDAAKDNVTGETNKANQGTSAASSAAVPKVITTPKLVSTAAVHSETDVPVTTSTGSQPAPAPSPVRTSGLSRLARFGSAANVNQPGSVSALPATTHGTANTADGTVKSFSLQLGERVTVGDNKCGILRYVGATHFAKGDWAGIELDEPVGKNDGSVEGRRYFRCSPAFGLFAPVSKVKPLAGSSALRSGTASSSGKRGSVPFISADRRPSAADMSLPSPLGRDHGGSQESLSSLSSVHSSASRSRMMKPKSSVQPSPQATTSALQKALKEKEEHVEQLLMERDLERAEIARMAAHVDEVEGQLASVSQQYQKVAAEAEERIKMAMESLKTMEQEKADLMNRFEEEKRKVEDLQFSVEEAAIDKGDFKIQIERDARKFKEMENQLAIQCELAESLQQQLNSVLAESSAPASAIQKESQQELSTSEIDSLREQLLDMTQKLEAAERHESQSVKEKNEQISQVETLTRQLHDKTGQILSLQSKINNVEDLQRNLAELQKELSDKNTKQHEQETSLNDLQQQLQIRMDKIHNLEEAKSKLECQMAELANSSGDSAKQMTLLNNALQDKDRIITELQSTLDDMKLKLAKASEETETIQVKTATGEERIAKLQAELDIIMTRLQEKDADIKHAADTVGKLTEQSELLEANFRKLEAEKEEMLSKKDHKLAELRDTLADKCDESSFKSQEIQSLAAQIELLTNKVDSSKLAEADKAEMARLTMERDELLAEVKSVTDKLKSLESQSQLYETKIAEFQEHISSLLAENNKLKADGDKELSSHAANEMELRRLLNDNESLNSALLTTKEATSELSKQVEEERNARQKCEMELKKLSEELSLASGSREQLEHNVEELKKKIHDLMETNKDLNGNNVELSNKLSAANVSLQDAKERHDELNESLKLERQSSVGSTESLQVQLKLKQADIDKLHNQVDILQKEIAELKSKQEKRDSSESEKDSKTRAPHVDANSNISTLSEAAICQIQEENESAQMQIIFLNSVIVDLQKKNDELQTKLDAFLSGESAKNDMENISSARQTAAKIIAPRLFCDICDVFDQHDTEDCPIQASSSSPLPDTNHNVQRSSSRPYCEICEVFGHSTEDCDDQQTF